MNILLDHCVPRRYLHLLQDWGHDAILMVSYLNSDAPDPDVIELASKLDAVLLTIDLDFANILDYPPASYTGILVLRYKAIEEAELDTSLKTVLTDLSREDLRGALVIVTTTRYRIRR